MTEPQRRDGGDFEMPVTPVPPPRATPRSAGAMLRAARDEQGLHIAVLAATIKVSTGKLEALENDRYDQLPNATFVRALAQSVCRSLKIDPRPVLAMLPQADAAPLEASVGRINTPFHERPSRDTAAFSLTSRSLFWAGGLLLVAAIAVYVAPPTWLQPDPAPAATDMATVVVPSAPQGASAAAVLPSPATDAPPGMVVETITTPVLPSAATDAAASAAAIAPPVSAASAASTTPAATTAAAAPAAGLVQLAVSGESWVEVRDAEGRVVLSRTLQAGESVGVDGTPPLRLTIGNAAATQLAFRGRPVDLAAVTRDNVARLELR